MTNITAAAGITRRGFLVGAGASVGALALWGSADVARAQDDGHTLVVVFLRGAMDGLSMVAPHADPGYRALRPTLRVTSPGEGPAAAQALPLGAGGGRAFPTGLEDHFGLHPAAAPLHAGAWTDGSLAIVHACGLPAAESATRSHFSAQEHWERGTASLAFSDGWLARHVNAVDDTRIPAAVHVGGKRTPFLLRGVDRGATVFSIEEFGVRGFPSPERATSVLGALYAGRTTPGAAPANDALAALDTIESVDTSGGPANGATYPDEYARLGDVAHLVRARVGLRAATIDIGGWDHHERQGRPEDPAGLFVQKAAPLAAGLEAFRRDLGDDYDRVTVAVLTEFGRTLNENGDVGTDHGRGGCVMFMGGRIRGGVYGDFPSVVADDPVDGDLSVLTDFRVPVAEVLDGLCGAPDVGAVFPTLGSFSALGLVAT